MVSGGGSDGLHCKAAGLLSDVTAAFVTTGAAVQIFLEDHKTGDSTSRRRGFEEKVGGGGGGFCSANPKVSRSSQVWLSFFFVGLFLLLVCPASVCLSVCWRFSPVSATFPLTLF